MPFSTFYIACVTVATLLIVNSYIYFLSNRECLHCLFKPDNLLYFIGDWRTTAPPNMERMLLNDNGPNAEERIVIFATDQSLHCLANSSVWFMDGNFSLAPKHFQQLYVIRVKVRELFITSVFCLLERKTQVTYENMLQTIIQKCAEREIFPDPLYVNMDFETSAINAVKNVLGEQVVIRGCFFHLTQSTHRKIQALGLERLYREEDTINHFCAMIDGLAFLPENDVLQGMLYLRTIVPDEAVDLLDYFDSTYVNGNLRRIGNQNAVGTLNFRRIKPLFPPATWNVHETTLASGERTNNQCEGWNNRFSNLVGKDHPNIWVLIKKIRLEVAADQTKMAQDEIAALSATRKRNVFQELQRRLKKLCEQYNQGTRSIEDFLVTIGHTIRFRPR